MKKVNKILGTLLLAALTAAVLVTVGVYIVELVKAVPAPRR